MTFSSMKSKMTFTVLLLVAFIMTATAVSALLYFDRTLKENISRDQFALLDAVATQIDQRIFDALVQLDTMADALTPALLNDRGRAQEFLDRQNEHQSFFDNTLFLFSPSGELLAASPRDLNLIGRDFSFRSYFKETMQTGRICVSAPFDSIQKQSPPLVMFTVPVYDRGGRIIAVLGGGVDLKRQHYLRSLATLRLGPNGFLSLYDSRRNVLMHPNPSRLLQQDPAGANPMLDRALAGFEGTSETAARSGIPVLRSVKRLKSTDWILAISYPLQDAYASLYTARKYLTAGIFLSLFLSALIVWPLMGRLTAPLSAFTRHLRRLPDLEESGREFPVSGEDEIGTVARAFNDMIAELGRRKNAITLQKEFAERLVMNSALPTFVIDPQHKLLFWNRACEEMTGIPAASVIGTGDYGLAFYGRERRCLADVIIDSSYDTLPLEHMVCARSRLIPDGWRCEGWYTHRGGQRRYIILDAAPIRDGSGTIIAAIETIQDITELKNAEQELERSRDFYLTLFENFPSLIWRSGTDAQCNYFNRTWLEFRGRTMEEELKDGWAEGVHPDDLERCVGTYLSSFGARKPFEMEYRLRRHDGRYRWIIDFGRPFDNLDGSFAGYIGCCYDITDRREAEQALRESENRYRQLFESNPHPMWVYDLETLGFIAVNAAAVRHYGFSREEFLSMTIRAIRPAEDVAALEANVSRVTGGIDEAGLWRHVKKDGSVIFVEITSHTLEFKGRPAEIVLAHDVTDRITAEEENRALEQQLRHAQKMEAIGTLAGGIAHDFNNILTAIVGFSTILQRKLGEEHPGNRQVERILFSADRAARLTHSLLAYSRKQIGNPCAVDLSGIVTGASHLLQRLVPESIRFDTFGTEQSLVVDADAGQIEQVLMNLVTNARDAISGTGELQIALSSIVLDEAFVSSHGYGRPGSYALLSVADSGAGMDQNTVERIFDPFFTTKEVGKGTGLGLAMVYGIVKQHAGFINCYSEPGHGTVFRIYLPLSEKDAPGPAPAEEGAAAGGDETILLVEDDEAVRELTRDLLEEAGYAVIMAMDGLDGVERFREHRGTVRLVILDAVMPRMSGADAFQAMYAMDPALKVLFTSGYTADILSGNLLVNDGCAVLTKPLRPGELLSTVRRILDGI